MLKHLLRAAGLQTHLSEVLSGLRIHLGEDETIWGVKFIEEEISSVELYVSNREEPSPVTLRTYEILQRVLQPWLDEFVPPPPLCPYTMVSFEFDLASARSSRAANAHFYVSSHLRAIAKDGYSYELGHNGITLKNHYRHFTLSEIDDLRNRVQFSPHISRISDIDRLLPEDFYGCRSISFAAKPVSDALYFRRLPFSRVVQFASAYGLSNVRPTLEAHRSEFGHLSWDVGYDFGRSLSHGDDRLVRKAAIYGLW